LLAQCSACRFATSPTAIRGPSSNGTILLGKGSHAGQGRHLSIGHGWQGQKSDNCNHRNVPQDSWRAWPEVMIRPIAFSTVRGLSGSSCHCNLIAASLATITVAAQISSARDDCPRPCWRIRDRLRALRSATTRLSVRCWAPDTLPESADSPKAGATPKTNFPVVWLNAE